MKHLRKYKIFESNTEIDKICRKYNIINYTINSDNSVDVDGDVNLWGKKLKSIPLNLNIVNGYFECGYNYLTSLKGCPVLKRKAIRGGSWKDISYYMNNSTRTYCYQDTIKSYIGFRCVQSYLDRVYGDNLATSSGVW
jgi:hypothetical protein